VYLRLKYPFEKLQWIALAISGTTFMLITAQETWASNSNNFYSQLQPLFYYLYVFFFLTAIFAVHLYDSKKICHSKRTIFIISVASMIVDLGVLFCACVLVLLSINQLPTDILKSITVITYIILPWSLGAVTLSSLTTDSLHKRNKELQKDIEALKEKMNGLQEDKEKREKELAQLENEFKKFRANRK
jgi:hypothetical protein